MGAQKNSNPLLFLPVLLSCLKSVRQKKKKFPTDAKQFVTSFISCLVQNSSWDLDILTNTRVCKTISRSRKIPCSIYSGVCHHHHHHYHHTYSCLYVVGTEPESIYFSGNEKANQINNRFMCAELLTLMCCVYELFLCNSASIVTGMLLFHWFSVMTYSCNVLLCIAAQRWGKAFPQHRYR